ncbi:protein of unknown function [Xenorhabdus nematophila AN6/1]|nr:protein of unknown function [Xenorhabdus nematophila AN6/1]
MRHNGVPLSMFGQADEKLRTNVGGVQLQEEMPFMPEG